MQEFFIMKGSVNPVLEMELINDGRYDFQKSLLNDALQDGVVTFNMNSYANNNLYSDDDINYNITYML